MTRRITRRRALGVVAGGAVVAGGGVGLVVMQDRGDLFRMVLAHYLGPIRMTDADMTAFIQHFRTVRPSNLPGEKLGDLWAAARRTGTAESARALLPADKVQTVEKFERWVLAEFHTVTDILWRASPGEPVAFLGRSACQNPYAAFESA